ncbi:retrotransposable element Tf2 [Tanacetum coccineum]|uniref:Retrotransposable element Tf2 n=1 Tax=Tanacetum coccineum TaxID=301880 RepID=A0ABQ5DD64_9ASTR
MSSAYHPQTDGQTEVVNKCLEGYLRLYGQPPPLHIPYVAKDSNVEVVDRTLQVREQTIQLLKFNLKKAQDRMKSQADKRRSEREFKEGDWVYLKLQPYRQLTISKPMHEHPVFHVSKSSMSLMMFHNDGTLSRVYDADGLIAATPYKLI